MHDSLPFHCKKLSRMSNMFARNITRLMMHENRLRGNFEINKCWPNHKLQISDIHCAAAEYLSLVSFPLSIIIKYIISPKPNLSSNCCPLQTNAFFYTSPILHTFLSVPRRNGFASHNHCRSPLAHTTRRGLSNFKSTSWEEMDL